MTIQDRLDLTLHLLAAAVREHDLNIARRALSAHDAIYRAERRLEILAFNHSSVRDADEFLPHP